MYDSQYAKSGLKSSLEMSLSVRDNAEITTYKALLNNVGARQALDMLTLGYRITSVIRRSFFPSKNNSKDVDPSYKTDLDLLDCLGRVKLVL